VVLQPEPTRFSYSQAPLKRVRGALPHQVVLRNTQREAQQAKHGARSGRVARQAARRLQRALQRTRQRRAHRARVGAAALTPGLHAPHTSLPRRSHCRDVSTPQFGKILQRTAAQPVHRQCTASPKAYTDGSQKCLP